MQWQLNQGHALVIERARSASPAARPKPRQFKLVGLVACWGAVWLLSLLVYGTKAWVKYSQAERLTLSHEHEALRGSGLIERLRIQPTTPPRTRDCAMSREPRFGYLDAACVEDNSCEHFPELDAALAACVLDATCGGVSLVPWENRYELRQSSFSNLHETFDGQVSYQKKCM